MLIIAIPHFAGSGNICSPSDNDAGWSIQLKVRSSDNGLTGDASQE